MRIDSRVRRRYEVSNEDARLWEPGSGELTRLRSWDIFDRLLPGSGTVVDIGGGPGTHSAYLARRRYEVTLLDPLPTHVSVAAARSAAQPDAPFHTGLAEARELPLADATVDAALLMGPLYHLVEREERVAALREVARVLRPGGRILAEIITPHAWLLDAARQGLLADAETWDDIDWNLRTGLSKDPRKVTEASFWAYFHRPEELADELELAGFADIDLVAVEGFAWLLGDLPQRMADPADLLRAVRLTESEPTMLGVSPHVIGAAQLSG